MTSNPAVGHLDQVRERAIGFALAVVHNRIGHLGSGKERLLFDIRDSLIYRGWAVGWHLQQLQSVVDALATELQTRYSESLDSPQLLFDHQHISHYIFDDVIFNSSSMFDYVGNLVGMAYIGPSCARLKWNGAVKAARDSNNALHAAPVASDLIDAHRNWVDALFSYRGDAVHYKVQLGSASHEFDLSSSGVNARLKVTIPEIVAKRLLRSDVEVDLVDGATWIAEESASRCNQILSTVTATLSPDYSW